jgi:hypothetical protein
MPYLHAADFYAWMQERAKLLLYLGKSTTDEFME